MADKAAGSPMQRVCHKISLALKYWNTCCKMNIENFKEMCIAAFPAGVGGQVSDWWVRITFKRFLIL
jgi:hypothetical protein